MALAKATAADLKIASMNIRSLVPQIDVVRAYVSINQPVILSLTETWIDHTIEDFDIDLFGYHSPFRLDRNRHGGGCALYTRSDFHSTRIAMFEDPSFEILC
ncbi:unnamed protein product, partial [Didymodactylos carnosus]